MDEVDRQILEAVRDEPLWKKRIHGEIAADRSASTVGRRVEQLVEDGHLRQVFARKGNASETLMDAFKLTQKGRRALKENAGDEE